jgi:hypothetical protein
VFGGRDFEKAVDKKNLGSVLQPRSPLLNCKPGACDNSQEIHMPPATEILVVSVLESPWDFPLASPLESECPT